MKKGGYYIQLDNTIYEWHGWDRKSSGDLLIGLK